MIEPLRLKLRLFTRPDTIVAGVPYHLAGSPADCTKRPIARIVLAAVCNLHSWTEGH
jgi:hypothetical protein